MSGMYAVPIMTVLSTPCCSHGTNYPYRIIINFISQRYRGCVKKKPFICPILQKNTLKEHSKFKKNIYDL